MMQSADDHPPPSATQSVEQPPPRHQGQAKRYPSNWHQRLIRYSLIALVLYLACVAAWEPLTLLSNRLFPPSPGLPPAPPMLLISSNLQAGTVTINGHKQAGTLPMLIQGQSHGFVLNIEDTITVDAPPFRPKVCQIKLPDALVHPDQNSVCQVISLDNAQPMTLNGLTARPDYWVYLPFSAEDLPPDQQEAVTNLLTQQLTTRQQTIAPAGARIATSADSSGHLTNQQTTRPLQASAILFPPRQLPPQFTYCGTPICPIASPETALTLPAGAWSIGATVALRWHFTTLSGQVISDVTFPAGGLVTLLLAYKATSGWHVLPPSAENPPVAAQRSAQFAALLCSSGMETLRNQAGTDAITRLADRGLQGCELSLKADQGPAPQFIWRFGVLLAANRSAQTLLPNVPVASRGDIAAVEG